MTMVPRYSAALLQRLGLQRRLILRQQHLPQISLSHHFSTSKTKNTKEPSPTLVHDDNKLETINEEEFLSGNEDDEDENMEAGEGEKKRDPNRNYDLEGIIRLGINALNRSSLAIQHDARAKKNIDIDGDGQDDETTVRQRLEEHHILKVAQACLERIVFKDPTHPLVCATGDPITLLSVSVNVTYTHADLFWTLPYSVLSQVPDPRQQMILQKAMEKKVLADGDLLRRIHGIIMKDSFAPMVRLKAAPYYKIKEMMEEME